MVAESVRKPLKMFQSSTGVLPAAMSTIMVSPTTRPTPIITAENRPDIAVGTTTCSAVCHGVAPLASEAARRWSGTAERASSASV
jgi:hypothetical protein